MINVLIIEDEHAIRRFLRTALEADGMRVFEAETLQRGLIEAATRKPDLAILDLGLPDGDGIDFIRDLRQWSQMPIIVLSARSEEHDKIAALDAGADDYLSKPFGIGEAAGPPARRAAVATARRRPMSRWCASLTWRSISPPAASCAAAKRST
ncbi:response regulator [Klebsiella pneumoniae subsp. pneumoniae]|nr:response regulator [Klebsiella pneumoniae subsp. pneumoniae]